MLNHTNKITEFLGDNNKNSTLAQTFKLQSDVGYWSAFGILSHHLKSVVLLNGEDTH